MDTAEFFLKVLGCVIRQEQVPEAPYGIDWGALYAMADRHKLAGMVASGLTGLQNVPPQVMEKFELVQNTELFWDITRNIEMDALFGEFDKRNIDYAPLKGWVMKEMYPEPVMRTMNDIDILFRAEQMKQVDEAMLTCGFTNHGKDSVHVLYGKEPGLFIEAHDYLLSNWSKYSSFYENPWRFFKPTAQNPNRFEMSPESIYLFCLLHFEKHMMNKGPSVQHVLDLYVLKKKVGLSSRDEWLNKALTQLKLLDFAQNAERLACMWFEDGTSSPELERIGKLILDSGKGVNASQSEYRTKCMVRSSVVKNASLFRRLFPTKEQLSTWTPEYMQNSSMNMFCIRMKRLYVALKIRGRAVVANVKWLGKGDKSWKRLYKNMHRRKL